MLRLIVSLCVLLNISLAHAEAARDELQHRYGTANDGEENHWDKRKEFVVETVQAFNPDMSGLRRLGISAGLPGPAPQRTRRLASVAITVMNAAK